MLELHDVETAYGRSQVLFGISLGVGASEVVTLLGRNGMGKTTTVKSIMGICMPKAGTIAFEGKRLSGLPSYRIAQAGLGLVPEGRQVFPNLTVRENLMATARRGGPWTLERVLIEHRTTLQDWILVRMQSAGAQGTSEMMCESHGRDA